TCRAIEVHAWVSAGTAAPRRSDSQRDRVPPDGVDCVGVPVIDDDVDGEAEERLGPPPEGGEGERIDVRVGSDEQIDVARLGVRPVHGRSEHSDIAEAVGPRELQDAVRVQRERDGWSEPSRGEYPMQELRTRVP